MRCRKFWFRQITVEGSLLYVLLLASCSVLKNTEYLDGHGLYDCHKNKAPYSNGDSLPQTLKNDSSASTLKEFFSQPSLKVADALGIIKELENLVEKKTKTGSSLSLEKKLELLSQVQFLHHHIMQAWLEISSVAGEMDCEEERADQLASYLKNKEDAFETRLTVTSIVLGALGGISSGFILTQNLNELAFELIGIGGGLASTILGMLILSKKKKIDYYHPNNALKEIWEGPANSKCFPPTTWFYLNQKSSNVSGMSLREELKLRWINYGQIDTLSSRKSIKTRQLFFGPGGRYTAEQLTNLANMYDQIESVVNLMKQDLNILLRELKKFYE
jgi:hypothetical protein